jgi:hypothetical protein
LAGARKQEKLACRTSVDGAKWEKGRRRGYEEDEEDEDEDEE